MQAFYCCYATGKQVPAQTPLTIPSDEYLSLAQRVLQKKGDFLGFIDAQDRTIQMMLEVNGGIVLDVPVPAQEGSYVKVIARDALDDFLLQLPTNFSELVIEDFAFAKW